MKCLTALPTTPSYIDLYISIRDRKHKTTKTPLTAAHALIEKRYSEYETAVKNENLEGLEKNAKAIRISSNLRSCYTTPTQPLKDLKKAIKKAQPKRLLKYCPMCGTTLPGTFDHYLPAVKFPEFSVHPLNLIPCCSRCNSTKDDDWLSATGARQFLHAYTDQIPDLQFIAVELYESEAFEGVGATFSLQMPKGIDLKIWKIIESHFQRLGLIERYDERSNDEVAEILSDCSTFIEAGGKNVRKFLKGRAKDRIKVYGRNHWIAVLMDSMCIHPNLLDWIPE